MTKDLALLIAPDHPYVTTQVFLETVESKVKELI